MEQAASQFKSIYYVVNAACPTALRPGPVDEIPTAPAPTQADTTIKTIGNGFLTLRGAQECFVYTCFLEMEAACKAGVVFDLPKDWKYELPSDIPWDEFIREWTDNISKRFEDFDPEIRCETLFAADAEFRRPYLIRSVYALNEEAIANRASTVGVDTDAAASSDEAAVTSKRKSCDSDDDDHDAKKAKHA